MTDKNNPERKRIREWIKRVGEWIKDRTGFFAYTDPKGEYHRGKTLWDWLQLLVIPAVFAGVGLWFNRTNDIRQEEIELDRQREEALQSYIDGMENLLLNKQLRASEDGSEVRAVAQARTFTVLRGLDGERRGSLLLFLYDAGLIGYEIPDGSGVSVPAIISLNDSDLTDASLWNADLTGADLSGADLSGADLTGADLGGADLWYANLRGATLPDAGLTGTDLTGADLTGADLTGAWLWDATLTGADLTDAWLLGATLGGADLEDAILRDARIDESTVLSEEQRKLFEAAYATAEPGEE